jgi:hypothetical protein
MARLGNRLPPRLGRYSWTEQRTPWPDHVWYPPGWGRHPPRFSRLACSLFAAGTMDVPDVRRTGQDSQTGAYQWQRAWDHRPTYPAPVAPDNEAGPPGDTEGARRPDPPAI